MKLSFFKINSSALIFIKLIIYSLSKQEIFLNIYEFNLIKYRVNMIRNLSLKVFCSTKVHTY